MYHSTPYTQNTLNVYNAIHNNCNDYTLLLVYVTVSYCKFLVVLLKIIWMIAEWSGMTEGTSEKKRGKIKERQCNSQGIVLNINVAIWWYCVASKLCQVDDDDDNFDDDDDYDDDTIIKGGKMKIETRRTSEQMRK